MTAAISGGARPFWTATPTRMIWRCRFRVSGERVGHKGKTFERGPMFARWEAPEQVTRPYPVMLVHGDGSQGTEWVDTPDGRPAGCSAWSRRGMRR